MAQQTKAPKGEGEHHGPSFTITIDGKEYETSAHELTVRQILELGGVDPETHVLVQILGRNQVKHEDLDEVIKINSGLKFVTVSREPTPVA